MKNSNLTNAWQFNLLEAKFQFQISKVALVKQIQSLKTAIKSEQDLFHKLLFQAYFSIIGLLPPPLKEDMWKSKSNSRLCENLQETSRHGQSRKIHSKTQARSWCGVVQRWETWLLKSFIQNYQKKYILKSHQSDMTWFSYPRLFHCGSQRRHLLRLKIRGKADILLVQSKGIWPIARNVDQFKIKKVWPIPRHI